MSKNSPITVFEHEKLFTNHGEKRISEELHLQLEKFHGDDCPFFSLIRNGVQFNEYVGVIQVGNTQIEVLPKADKFGDEGKWRNLLIGMIRTIWGFEVKQTGNSHLKVKNNSILDLYFELFITETEKLLHKGLIKKYQQNEGNLTALKGSLQFSKHISQNLTHQERFFTKHTKYSVHHDLHKILFKALKLISKINTNVDLQSRIGSLLLNFPEMHDIKVNASTFDKVVYSRKNQHYKPALEIAKLLLLNYHPDVSKGRNNVLALMFDMNLLWEQFIFITLKRNLTSHKTVAQPTKKFWKLSDGANTKMKADILITNTENQSIVLDTKWKNLGDYNPTPDDLRQMYVYHRYYGAINTALVYPGEIQMVRKGNYYSSTEDGKMSEKECSVIFLKSDESIKLWQDSICMIFEKSF